MVSEWVVVTQRHLARIVLATNKSPNTIQSDDCDQYIPILYGLGPDLFWDCLLQAESFCPPYAFLGKTVGDHTPQMVWGMAAEKQAFSVTVPTFGISSSQRWEWPTLLWHSGSRWKPPTLVKALEDELKEYWMLLHLRVMFSAVRWHVALCWFYC